MKLISMLLNMTVLLSFFAKPTVAVRKTRTHLQESFPAGMTRANHFLVWVGNDLMLPVQRIYADYNHHFSRVPGYPKQNEQPSWTVFLATLLFAISFFKVTGSVDWPLGRVMGTIADCLRRNTCPIMGSLDPDFLPGFVASVDGRQWDRVLECASADEQRDAIIAYVEDFRDNGIGGSVPFPSSWIKNPWRVYNDNNNNHESNHSLSSE